DLGRLNGAGSIRRQARAEGAMAAGRGAHTAEAIKAALRDHDGRPHSVCAHPDPGVEPIEDYVTVASLVMDLTEGALELTSGPPCESEYERFGAGDLFEAARS